jgi:transglutaminase-like putative cysteine protease
MGTQPPYGVPDFAAWFEVYLGGTWHTFDARNNVPRIGRVLIARGRHAADVAIATTAINDVKDQRRMHGNCWV